MKTPTEPCDICIHLGDDYNHFDGAITPPLFQNTLFTSKTMDHGYSYTRVSNPTVCILEKKLAALEKAEAALVFSSGIAAVSTVLSALLSAGDHIIALRSIYGPAANFIRTKLSSFGISNTFVIDGSVEELEEAIRPETKVIYLESPSSLIYKIQDLRAVSALCRNRGITTVIDNTWATPLYQNPIELGIDIVVHSATKYLGGHSDVMAGVAMGSQALMDRIRIAERSLYGTIPDPFAAWLLLRSLRTLDVRVKRHSQNAMKIACFLEQHPKVRTVYYPGLPSHPGHELACMQMRGFTGLMSIELDANPTISEQFCKNLEVFEEGPSWGGFESLVLCVGSAPETRAIREFQCVPDGLIRLSIGLENVDTILSDLEQALGRL